MNPIERHIAKSYSEPSTTILMVGQSNMAGRDVDGTNLTSRTNDSTIYEYRINEGAGVRSTFQDIYPNGGSITAFGPDVGMMRTLRSNGETNNYAIRYHAGGHSITAFLPESDRLTEPASTLPDGNTDRSSLLITFIDNCLDDMLARYFRNANNIKFVWYQGAEDSKTNTLSLHTNYEAHLQALVNRMSGIYPLSKFIIIRSPDWNSNTPDSKPNQDVVRAAQVSVANANSLTEWLNSDENQSVATTWEDASHIDAASQERLGIDLANAL